MLGAQTAAQSAAQVRRSTWNTQGERTMKPTAMAGVVLALFGAFVLFTYGFSFGYQRSLLGVGDLEVSAEERRTVPDWAGGVALLMATNSLSIPALDRRGPRMGRAFTGLPDLTNYGRT